MNYIAIILAIIIVSLLYFLYVYIYASQSTLTQNASLKTTTTITTINKPTNTRYAYGIWVYVNSWNNLNKKVIFSRNNNISLYLDQNKPSLYCDITMNKAEKVPLSTTTLITDNFPIQKWVYVILSVDNQFLDCYLDGKLVKSSRIYVVDSVKKMTYIPLAPSATTPILLGAIPFDAAVSRFNRWTHPMDPQTAWDNYMKGNGNRSIMSATYGADLSIKQNNLEFSKINLF